MRDFELGSSVRIIKSNKPGTIEGMCVYTKNNTQYLVEFVDGKGDLANAWVMREDIAFAD